MPITIDGRRRDQDQPAPAIRLDRRADGIRLRLTPIARSAEWGSVMPEDLRALRLCVEAAIASEESNASKLSQAADQVVGHPLAHHLSDIARKHRVHALMLRARLDALLKAYGELASRE